MEISKTSNAEVTDYTAEMESDLWEIFRSMNADLTVLTEKINQGMTPEEFEVELKKVLGI